MSNTEVHSTGPIFWGLALSCLFGLVAVLSIGPSLASESFSKHKVACAQSQAQAVPTAGRESPCAAKPEQTEVVGFDWPL